MKKLLKSMTLICLTLCFALSMTLTFLSVDVMADSLTNVSSDTAADMLEEFVTACPQRPSNSVGEQQAGLYIEQRLQNIGYTCTQQPIANQTRSFNVVATLDNANSQQKIVIGAHYDAISMGVQDNATGVVALLLIAEQLFANKDSLPCDIDIVAFGSEESGLLGSSHYVNTLSVADRTNTVLMINIDSIGAGDNLYVYGENRSTDYINTLIDNGSGSQYSQLKQKPLNKGLMYGFDYYGYGYYHMAQNSDHTPFRLNGIPTAFYYSGTYDTFGGAYLESTNSAYQVMNTTNDTWDNLTEQRIEQYAQRIVCVVDSVVISINNDGTVLLDAPNQLVSDVWYNTLYPIIIVVALAIILVIIALSYSKKLTKIAILGGAPAAKQTRVFTKPEAEDIFDLEDKK